MRRIVLAAMMLSPVLGCEYDDGDWDLDQSSGAATARGGRPSMPNGGSSVGEAARTGSGGTGNRSNGGSGGTAAPYPAPKITSMDPRTGAYGTLVTIRGEGLGNPNLDGFALAIGNQGEVALTPTDDDTVVSWTDDEITFRFPFPAEGAVALEAPKGAELAGEFQPTWHIAQEVDKAPAATVLASISPALDHIALLFDTMPKSLLDIGPDGVTEHAVMAEDVDPSSLRLYLNAQKKIEAVGVSTDAAPKIVHLRNVDDDLVAKATTLELGATEYAVAGGSEGAAVWMHRDAGWFRARPSGATWAQDKGPVADAHASDPDRAIGATSDGSLFVAWSVDTGNLLDDMEAARMAKVGPAGTKLEGSRVAGPSVDDYVTQLTLRSSGDGLVVKTCGSDVDPFGLSGTSYYCFASLHAAGGASLLRVPLNEKSAAYAFTNERAVAAYCSSDQTWMIQTDADVAPTPETPVGEAVLFPCPEAVALEVNGEGDYLPVVRWAGKTYLLERNPKAVVDPG
ncbi:MAG: hypothetical protein K0R38_4357 [Polyangiaceae bacterium]|jgi:hypothetical protein|nr:hypothetical protein [Polyangiaceae bacterium]